MWWGYFTTSPDGRVIREGCLWGNFSSDELHSNQLWSNAPADTREGTLQCGERLMNGEHFEKHWLIAENRLNWEYINICIRYNVAEQEVTVQTVNSVIDMWSLINRLQQCHQIIFVVPIRICVKNCSLCNLSPPERVISLKSISREHLNRARLYISGPHLNIFRHWYYFWKLV